MDIKLIVLYFVLGGTIVSAVTYLGSMGKGITAAFIAMFPVVTVLTFSLIYLEKGADPTISYAQGLVILTPAWLLYLAVVIFAMPKTGLAVSLMLGVPAYLAFSLLIMKLLNAI